MKRVLMIIICFYSLTGNAQNYLISFAGTGASTTVSTVKVENLTKGTNLSINGSDILSLTSATGINSIEDNQSSELKIYPNPMTNNAILEIFPPIGGDAIISVYDMTGKLIAQIQSSLESSRQEFRLSGLENGFYLISIKSRNYHFSGKLLSNGKSNSTISIEKVNNIIQVVDEKVEKTDPKGIQATVNMAYSSGDRLKLTGISGNFSTVIIDVPIESKEITFNFIGCTDENSNNYPIVKIGQQIWMAENLRTTKYRNGDLIGTTTPATLDITSETTPKYQWAYGGNESNVATYGRLYTWFVVTDSRSVCPTSWHVPTDPELTALTTYLGGSSIAGGKLKESGFTHWSSPNTGATNETGFTALPSGYRYNDGNFYVKGANIFLWSSTDYSSTYAFYRSLFYLDSNVGRNIDGNFKHYGYSVRCIKDN
jgi:uncharacterized protein (TIGR02145 family)